MSIPYNLGTKLQQFLGKNQLRPTPNQRECPLKQTATITLSKKNCSHTFAEEEPKDYTFENKELSAEPQLDRFDLQELSI
jgi:hypothetical protein